MVFVTNHYDIPYRIVRNIYTIPMCRYIYLHGIYAVSVLIHAGAVRMKGVDVRVRE
jgi:hypothetical protein